MCAADAMRTDADWEQLAQAGAYWAVLTQDRFRGVPTDGARAEFFNSGEADVEAALSAVRASVAPGFAPRRALDFGCGVGRLLLPLARRCEQVVGVDVSDTMLREAAANCHAAGAGNVELVKGDDELSAVRGRFDFVHTLIVLQHIPVERGERIFRRLVELVAPGGCGALHVTYGSPPTLPPARQAGNRLGVLARAVLRPLRRRLRGRGAPAVKGPEMQMNVYSLNALFRALQNAGAEGAAVRFTDHGGWAGIQILFRIPGPA
jgi:SAM-dependent methyltransferase